MRPSFSNLLEIMQKYIGFINVSDALTEAMLNRSTGHQKSKNERRAARERSGETENDRHAAWERSCGPDGPDGSPMKRPQKMFQTVVFKRFWVYFALLKTWHAGPLCRQNLAYMRTKGFGAQTVPKTLRTQAFLKKILPKPYVHKHFEP